MGKLDSSAYEVVSQDLRSLHSLCPIGASFPDLSGNGTDGLYAFHVKRGGLREHKGGLPKTRRYDGELRVHDCVKADDHLETLTAGMDEPSQRSLVVADVRYKVILGDG